MIMMLLGSWIVLALISNLVFAQKQTLHGSYQHQSNLTHHANLNSNISPEAFNVTSVTKRTSMELPTFSFFAMGDVPYNELEAVLLSKQIEDINKEMEHDNTSFLIHLGDLMRSGNCNMKRYQRSSVILNTTKIPVVVIPGDNDWIDCPNFKIGMERFKIYFIDRFDLKQTALPLKRQTNREENFSMWIHNVMFMGLNVRTYRDLCYCLCQNLKIKMSSFLIVVCNSYS